jgi:Ca-activated chloride channel family protein
MTIRRAHFAIAGLLLGATALVGARAAWLAPPPAGAAGPTTVTAPGGGRVTFTGTVDRTRVLRGGDGSVRMELVMRARADQERVAAVRRPTDLVIVLDRSGSMMGEKIEQARAAVRELVGQLAPDDRFALVTYANLATVTIPFAAADARARGGWLETLASVTADGGTNISNGLDVGMDLVEASRKDGRTARVILISDGLANQGDPSNEGLLRRAGRAAHGEYVLSTVGVGADFNEYLMTALADAGTGNYYFVHAGGDLANVFAREFDAARTTVASALTVDVDPGAGIRVVDAGGYPLESTGTGIRFRPGALFAGQERRIWVTLAVPSDALGDRDLGRFTLAYGDAASRSTLTLADVPRIACVTGEDDFYAGIDKEAWARAVVVDSYNKMQADVARDVKEGRRDQALGKVRAFKDEATLMNRRVNAPAVAAQLGAADRFESDVASAFEGENQAAKQNELSKRKSAESVDARRVGAKKQ